MKASALLFPKALLTLAMLTTGATTTAQSDQARQAAELSDGEIVQVIKTLNDGEIMHSELAQEKAESEDVKTIAMAIQADHEMSNMTIEMLEEQGIELMDNPLSERLQAQAMQASEQLSDLEGQEFDCSFLTTQAELHQMALETVMSQLLPQAEDEAVTQLLNRSTMSLEHHLEAAEAGLESMQGCDSGNA